MCGSMVDIHSATAEIRRKKERKKKPQGKNIMSASATQGGCKHRRLHIFLVSVCVCVCVQYASVTISDPGTRSVTSAPGSARVSPTRTADSATSVNAASTGIRHVDSASATAARTTATAPDDVCPAATIPAATTAKGRPDRYCSFILYYAMTQHKIKQIQKTSTQIKNTKRQRITK